MSEWNVFLEGKTLKEIEEEEKKNNPEEMAISFFASPSRNIHIDFEDYFVDSFSWLVGFDISETDGHLECVETEW